MPPEVVERAAERGAERVIEEVRSVSFERSGMLPDPAELAQYESSFPGLGGRIVAWTEDELLHRRALERRSVDATIEVARRGQLLAYSWSVLALVAAVVLGLAGENAGAIAALAGALVPALVALIAGSRRGSSDG